ncbi:hypothetical protein FP263_23850 [Salmonella enterica subsp. enterica]|nr:hypothetical protein [Salmonella enterica subsp. enterica serovar Newport]
MNTISFLTRGRSRDTDRKIRPSGLVCLGGALSPAQVNLDVAFGQQPTINPLTARLTGNVAGVMKVFNRCGWQAEPDSGTSLPHQYSLMAGQGVPGKGD